MMNINKAHKVKTIQQCLNIISNCDSQIIAGGTDLVIKMSDESIPCTSLVDISSVEELSFIEVKNNVVEIGATTTFAEIINYKRFPMSMKGFEEAMKSIGSPQIRNVATLGGNICNGSPAADSVPVLIVLDAKLKIISLTGERIVDIDKFFLGKGKVDLLSDELLKSISFQMPVSSYQLNFYKYSLRESLAITLGSLAALIKVEDNIVKDIKIGPGGFSEFCVKEKEMESRFIDKQLNSENIEDLIEYANELVNERIQEFDHEFQAMKNITLDTAIRKVIKDGGKYEN